MAFITILTLYFKLKKQRPSENLKMKKFMPMFYSGLILKEISLYKIRIIKKDLGKA